MHTTDNKTVSDAQDVLNHRSKVPLYRRILPFLGPAFIASVAYVDPGNFATNIAGGAQFGYTLVWVIVASNIMAMVLQTLSAKLGIATGKNLAEHCRDHFPRPIVLGLWVIMEAVALSTDLAEFLGAAIGFQLLFGIPLIYGGILTAITTFIILGLERYGFRPIEAVITGFVGIIAVSYIVETFLGKPDFGAVVHNTIVPHFAGAESVVVAAGILGATVMPHAIFLHSALTQGRIVVREPQLLKRLLKFEIADVVIAMGLAGFVNMAMLVMAATTFHAQGFADVVTLEQAHRTLEPLLGKAASGFFAISLLAAGLSSSTVGTSAGQIMMQGFIKRHIPVYIRRIITIVPSLAVIAIGLNPTRTLVISQVVLSFGLPFTVVPLVLFTQSKKIMGVLVNKPATTIIATVFAGMIIALNIYLITQLFKG